ncbi:MAG: SsrA-binding protein SmpB [Chitinophagales bacterium]|nr:SsrA-binding protein SmpB [Chitinophagales bacterium]
MLYLCSVKQTPINIKNKRARFDFELLQNYVCGIQLTGTEIKAIRSGKAHINEAFCQMRKGELYVVNMHIAEYTFGTHYNHVPNQPRKLLLNKRELRQIHKKITEKGLTIIPTLLFLSDRGFAKLEIAVAKGKKTHDKRQSLKDKDNKRELDRIKLR